MPSRRRAPTGPAVAPDSRCRGGSGSGPAEPTVRAMCRDLMVQPRPEVIAILQHDDHRSQAFGHLHRTVHSNHHWKGGGNRELNQLEDVVLALAISA